MQGLQIRKENRNLEVLLSRKPKRNKHWPDRYWPVGAMNLTNSTPAVAVVNTLQTLPLFNNAVCAQCNDASAA